MLRSTLACLSAVLMIGVVGAAPTASAQAVQNAAPPAHQDVRGHHRNARPDRQLAPVGRRNSLSGRRHAARADRHARFARRARFTSRRHARVRARRHVALHRQMRMRHARRRRNARYFWAGFFAVVPIHQDAGRHVVRPASSRHPSDSLRARRSEGSLRERIGPTATTRAPILALVVPLARRHLATSP